MAFSKHRQALWISAAMVLLVGAAVLTPANAKADAAGCRALNGKLIAPAAFTGITVPWGGQVSLAEYIPAKDGVAAFCKVVGQVNPVDQKAYPVLFAVNLPDNWNGKVVQQGGNGVNGTLVTGLNAVPDQPADMQTPLGRGYVTAGTDAGHPGGALIYEFMSQPEEFENHAHLAYKKTHDATVDLVNAYYKKKPSRFYYVGSSEGGRESMIVAQKYPADYDGVVAGVPVMNWTGLRLSDYNQWLMLRDGGWPNNAKLALVQKAANDACDVLDGLKDGVISNYGKSCEGRVDLSKLRCPDGSDIGDACLSDKQIAFFNQVHTPFTFSKPLARGAMSYPAWFWGGEAQPQAYVGWRIQANKPDDVAAGQNSVGLMRFGIMGDPKFSGPIPWEAKGARILEISNLMDATDPDLTPFMQRGGKMIIKENGADYAQSPTVGFAYRQAVIDKMGTQAASSFMRFFVNPGVVHIGVGLQADGSNVPDKVDLLGVLDAWVEGGPAPETLTVTSYTKAAPFTAVASRPLCQYPFYPRYRRGDVKLASSFVCTAGGDSK